MLEHSRPRPAHFLEADHDIAEHMSKALICPYAPFSSFIADNSLDKDVW